MTFRNPVQYTVVASGTTVSSPFDLRGVQNPGLIWPVSLGHNIFLAAAITTNSGDFQRVAHEVSSLTLWWNVTSPDNTIGGAIAITDISPFPYGRIEVGSPTSSPQSFTIVGKNLP